MDVPNKGVNSAPNSDGPGSSDKIIVHLVEGFRTVIVDDQVKFRSVISSITDRLTKQYFDRERQEDQETSASDDNIYGWIFGIRWNCQGRKVWIHPETSHGEFLDKFDPYRKTTGILELRVRYFPSDFVDVHKRHRIIFTLMYKQVLYEYLKRDDVPLELATKLAVLEIKRKYPALDPKAAKMIANGTNIIPDDTYKTFYPEKLFEQYKLRDLRRQVVKQFQVMEEVQSSDAVIQFLRLVKKHLFFFDREYYSVKLGERWPIASTVVIGPDCQISYGQQGHEPQPLTQFAQVSRIETFTEPSLQLVLNISGKTDPLYIKLSSYDELENLADLVDGYCRGAKNIPEGTLIQSSQSRQLPDIPAQSFESLSHIPQALAQAALTSNNLYQNNIDSDDDYAVIGEVEENTPRFDPQFELDRSQIQLIGEIGQGQFGNVHCANYTKGGIKALVAVKKTNFEEDEEMTMKFIEEAHMMCQFGHKHIVQLIGVCTKEWPILIVMEFCALGCIRDYLLQNSDLLTASHLIEYIYQLSSALAYLDEHKFVHRDIAARNLLLTNEHTVKLGDFGLSRKIKETDTYYVATTGKLPIKWMAPESINFRKFTSQSDIWMFGVCSWEIMSCGLKPFQGVKNNDVIEQIENGVRLDRPEKCPMSLFRIMQKCWKYQSIVRPSASELHEEIGYLLDSFNQDDSDNVYIVNSEVRTMEEFNNSEVIKAESAPFDPLMPVKRNPSLPPKSFPKEVREDTARLLLEERENRNSMILNDIQRQQIEETKNQEWLEEQLKRQSQGSLNRSQGSLGSRSSREQMKSAPPKPPRSAKLSGSDKQPHTSSHSTVASDDHNPYASITIRKDPSSRTSSPPPDFPDVPKEITPPSKPHSPTPIKPLLEEMPTLQLKDVVLDKTKRLDRSNDAIWTATLALVKELITLRNSAETARPDSLVAQIQSIGAKCQTLDKAVVEFAADPKLDLGVAREIDLEKRSVYAEMKQVIHQISNVRNFDGTKTAGEYRNVLMASILVMSISVKNLQDAIDKARQLIQS